MANRKYTILRPDPSLKNNLMAFGFECGPGWKSMIWELLNKIQNFVDEHPEHRDLEVLQIKEKWGGLRVYMLYDIDEIEDLIEEYKDRSWHTCESCGSPGETSGINGWYQTLCEKFNRESEK